MSFSKFGAVLKSVAISVGAVVLVVTTFYVITEIDRRTAIEAETRAVNICPPLLSITRSARDTLIVMRAEPVCNKFVLDNFE